MLSHHRNRIAIIAGAALLAAAVVGYLAYGAHKKRVLKETVTALVQDASGRLQDALAGDAGPAAADISRSVRKLDENVAALERQLAELHRLNPSRNRPLVDAADLYLVTTHEILKSQSAGQRHRLQLTGSALGLREFMRSANRRSKSWIDDALAAKLRLDQNYFDYKQATDTRERLLLSLPEVRTQLVAQVGAAPLIDENLVKEARKRSQDTAQQAADEMEKARQLASAR